MLLLCYVFMLCYVFTVKQFHRKQVNANFNITGQSQLKNIIVYFVGHNIIKKNNVNSGLQYK